jgi:hypothetical protein
VCVDIVRSRTQATEFFHFTRNDAIWSERGMTPEASNKVTFTELSTFGLLPLLYIHLINNVQVLTIPYLSADWGTAMLLRHSDVISWRGLGSRVAGCGLSTVCTSNMQHTASCLLPHRCCCFLCSVMRKTNRRKRLSYCERTHLNAHGDSNRDRRSKAIPVTGRGGLQDCEIGL